MSFLRSRWARPVLNLFFFATTLWAGNAAAAQLKLNWTDMSTNEVGFKVERKAGTTGTFIQLAAVGANVVTYTDSSITGGSTYCYRVRAYNIIGDSSYTNEACGAASADTQAPLVSLTAPSNGATVSGSSVTVSASASDNAGVAGVQFILDGNNLGSEDTASPYSISWNTTTVANGSHTLTVRARDAAGNQATSSAVTVTVSNQAPPPPPPPSDVTAGVVVAVNAGGPQYTAADGTLYQADTAFSGGATSTNTSAVADTEDDPLYHSYRWGNVSYVFPLPSGEYAVTLQFAEMWWNAPAQRLFDVLAEGETIINRLDVYAVAGRYTAHDVTLPVTVTDGALNLEFRTLVNNAQINAIKVATKTITPPPPAENFTLAVAKAGTGSGALSSSPNGINCGADCSAAYPSGTIVTLTATPVAGSTFAGWSGDADCNDGQVTMTTAKTCTASFNLLPPLTFALTVTKAGTGSGAVTATGINCGADCSETYLTGAVVALKATPSNGSTFAGWSGHVDCSDGSVTMDATKICTATFTAQMKVKIGVYRAGQWFLDLNGNGLLDDCASGGCPAFGNKNYSPVVGDWLGNGMVQIGVFNTLTREWMLDRNANDLWEGCTVDFCLGPIGSKGDLPVVGRWTTSAAADFIGLYRPKKQVWYLDLNGNGTWNNCSQDGCWSFLTNTNGAPVMGDWTNSGTTKLGIFDPTTGQWKLDKNGNGKWDGCSIDLCQGPFGLTGDLPVAGDWNGSGTSRIGTFDPTTGMWELDLNGNGMFDGCAIDACLGPFGQKGDLPVVGKW